MRENHLINTRINMIIIVIKRRGKLNFDLILVVAALLIHNVLIYTIILVNNNNKVTLKIDSTIYIVVYGES